MIRTWFPPCLSAEPPDASEAIDPLPDMVSIRYSYLTRTIAISMATVVHDVTIRGA